MVLFLNNKGLSNKSTSGMISVKLQTWSLMRDKIACKHISKRYFSAYIKKYLSEARNKWHEMKLFQSLRWYFNTILNCLFNLLKLILISSVKTFRWIFRRFRNLLLAMRRMLRYKIPLAYLVIINFISISTGMYAIGMSVIYYDEKLKAEAAKSEYDFIKLPDLQDVN